MIRQFSISKLFFFNHIGLSEFTRLPLLELGMFKGRRKTIDIYSVHSVSSGNSFPVADGGFYFFQHLRFGALGESEEWRTARASAKEAA